MSSSGAHMANTRVLIEQGAGNLKSPVFDGDGRLPFSDISTAGCIQKTKRTMMRISKKYGKIALIFALASFIGACDTKASQTSTKDGDDSTDSGSDAGGKAGKVSEQSDSGANQKTDSSESDNSKPPYAVGTVRIEISAGEDRTIPVQLWYPAVESARAEATEGHPTEEFEPAGDRRDQLASMMAKSPDGCTSKVMHAAHAPDVLSQSSPFPAVVVSHCMDCVRFSTFTVAEHLASLGFVVAGPDHVNGTIYDAKSILDDEFLQVRANDIKSVIDMLLDAQSSLLPTGLRAKIDPDRIGMYGHSYGSTTTGRVLQNDSRVKAGVMIAAAVDTRNTIFSPALKGTPVDDIKQPGLFLEAMEDSPLFDPQIEADYEAYPNPAWLVQLKDAGHFSFTDIASLNNNMTFAGSCGTGTRQASPSESVTYIDNDVARSITKTYIAAFFKMQLNGDETESDYLETATPADMVDVKHHP
jgi:predicted dienelactone hydrolase